MRTYKETPIRPKITGNRLLWAIERYATAYSMNSTAAVHQLLTQALIANKFLTIDPEEPLDYAKTEKL